MERKAWREKPSSSSENRHRGCGRDMLRQTVPSASGGNRKGPIANSGHVYDGQSAMMRRWSAAVSGPQNWPDTGAHWRGNWLVVNWPCLQHEGWAYCSTDDAPCHYATNRFAAYFGGITKCPVLMTAELLDLHYNFTCDTTCAISESIGKQHVDHRKCVSMLMACGS